MERLVQELDKYMKDFDENLKVSYWAGLISLDYKNNPMIDINLIEERFELPGCSFEEDDELSEQIDFIECLKYNKFFVDKFLKLFNSKDKYVYYYQLNGFDYYLYSGTFGYADDFDTVYFGMTTVCKPRFFEDDDRLNCVNTNKLAKVKNNNSFGDNKGEWNELQLSDTEKNLLEQLLFNR